MNFNKKRTKAVSIKVISIIGLIAMAVINLVPFVWGALTAMKPGREVAIYPPKLFGSEITAEHYEVVLKGTFSRAMVNSAIYSVVAIILGILCAMLIAYALTRYRFVGKKALFLIVLFGIPLSMGSASLVVPNYMLFSTLRMANKWFTLPLIYTAYNLPMAVWIMIGGMQSVPYAIEEAAMIDGASKWYIIFRLIPRLNYWLDGNIGQRSLFISAEDESFIISFEEGMRCIDLAENASGRRFEYRWGERYLHQVRSERPGRNTTGSWSFFHMEITDHAGNIHWLPGQMVAWAGYPWTEGVEPLLVEILNSISVF